MASENQVQEQQLEQLQQSLHHQLMQQHRQELQQLQESLTKDFMIKIEEILVRSQQQLQESTTERCARCLQKVTHSFKACAIEFLDRCNIGLPTAIVAFVVNLVMMIVAFCVGRSSLYYAFGMDCAISVFTSLVLLWCVAMNRLDAIREKQRESRLILERLRTRRNAVVEPPQLHLLLGAENSNNDNTEQTVEEMSSEQWREKMGQIALGFVMAVAGLCVCVRIAMDIYAHSFSTYQSKLAQPGSKIETELFYMLIISAALNVLLMVFKFFVYHTKGSQTMLIEAINSFASALFAFLSAIAMQFSEYLADFDLFISLFFGFFLCCYGQYCWMPIYYLKFKRYFRKQNVPDRSNYQQFA